MKNLNVQELSSQEIQNVEGGVFWAAVGTFALGIIGGLGSGVGMSLYNNYPYPLINQYNSFAPIPGSYYY
ncbi:hypothetical protein [Chryseobacterium fistulae]|uniref:Class IIb bacteriocin, lactobin A/cerein 7B family n=1 Tax=Chryseobacterium fistulae TaxID=2675058 RepID=A0A6N4XT32_9FLAO|nr:hypothetical protein [Chryseobacterium fistulae]CAA7392634.1 hypothetical protein CHRY9393_03360 [Chryseobacterium fistulae]